MSDIIDQAKSYLKANAAESGADVLIEELVKELNLARNALKKVRSYNVDIDAGRINYRPLDHIRVIDSALPSGNRSDT